MELPDRAAKGILLRPVRSPKGSAEIEMVRPGRTIDGPGQHHCADHAFFHPDCLVCKQACANFQPYPVRETKPVARSFGFDDDLTAEKIRALNPKPGNLYSDDPEFSLSLGVIRFLLRLIWPFKF